MKKEYRLSFYPERHGSGWAFPCDEEGHVNVDQLQPEGRANYEMCMEKYSDLSCVEVFRHSYWDSGVMKCDCGQELFFRPGGDCTCKHCGASYNSAGQRLAPRSQWGEETGETAEDYDEGVRDAEYWRETGKDRNTDC